MTTTCDFIDAIKARYSLPSDYAAAGKLGMTRAAISSYRNHRSFLDDTAAIKVAELLEIDPGYVAACAHAERAKKAEEKALWQSIMQRLGGAAALVLIGLGGLSAPAPTQATDAPHSVLCKKRRQLRRLANSLSFAQALHAFMPIRTIQQV